LPYQRVAFFVGSCFVGASQALAVILFGHSSNAAARLHHQLDLTMHTQWILEMRHPGDGGDSLITTDEFDDFAAVERKIKQNREMVFVVKPPAAPLPGELLMLYDLRNSGLKIERP
jgi:hypothetical protein